MSSIYHKYQIYRVMNWITDNSDNNYMITDKTKFNELVHYFKLYFKTKEKEKTKRKQIKLVKQAQNIEMICVGKCTIFEDVIREIIEKENEQY